MPEESLLLSPRAYYEHGATMKRYKYRMKNGKELWVCEACKKARAEHILLGELKLIDRKEDDSACEFCSSSTIAPQQQAELCVHQ